MFIGQFHEYKKHRLQLISNLTIINPNLAKMLAEESKQTPRFKQSQEKKTLPFFFFLNKKTGQYENIRPSILKKQIQWTYELPANANRHFLRTRLRELDVPGEIVDAYMGHWEHGQEPFGKFSTLSAESFKKLLSPAIEEICLETGWKVIKGISKR